MAVKNKEAFKRLEEIFEAGRDADEERAESVRILIAVDTEAPRDFVTLIKEALMPVRSSVAIDVRLVGDVAMDSNGVWDACIVIAGGSDELVEHAAVGVGRRGNPVVVVGQSVLDIPDSCLVEPLSAFVSTIAASDSRSLEHELSRWLMQETTKQTAIAASFPFCRAARVTDLTKACAAQNAAIGLVNLLPGSDLPYITVNQAKLALDIASVYGKQFSFERVPELISVVGAAFVYRSIARFAVGLIPGLGRLLRAGVAYAGTLSTSQLIAAHFDYAEDPEPPSLKDIRNDVVERATGFASDVASAAKSVPEIVNRVSDLANDLSGFTAWQSAVETEARDVNVEDVPEREASAPNEAPREYVVYVPQAAEAKE